uniref:protein-serine/threonine phosphatase n=1 Tax=Chenopodium quinoa TaxID=63459 RepID=A0A803L727_CHEQI
TLLFVTPPSLVELGPSSPTISPSGDAQFSPKSSSSRSQSPPRIPPPISGISTMTTRDPDAVFSGGGISFLTGERNVRFSYGYSTFKGKRSSMEDYFETKISEVGGQMVAFFGVFDGHGGPRTAEYLKNNLFNNLCNHPDFFNDTKSAIVEAFKQTDANFLSEDIGQQKDAGSTASTVLLVGDRLLVANVGDSRVVSCRDGSGKFNAGIESIPLSIDHKPDRSDERQRIEDAGGFVIWAGTWRVGGVLAISRAFGDKLLKQFVIAEPEIKSYVIDYGYTLRLQDAVSLVQDIKDAEAASRKLTEEAFTRGSSDNITCLVIRFENEDSQ